ncbi:coiled-coil domain-containing protein 186 isoform X2 [Planococcus citri]|uniref:coiled-coil domain-containing protein 186 isoform X2 n=1 Tax=Planococcus citri TaxID=170843 RepID=UPI0031F9D872
MDVNCIEALANPSEEVIDKCNNNVDECNAESKSLTLSGNPTSINNALPSNELENQTNSSETKFNDVKIERADSSSNIFVEIPVNNKSSDNYSSDSEDSVIFSNDGDDGFSTNSKPSEGIDKPKDLLTEISDILVSLSDDERFVECINFSNNNGFILQNNTEKKSGTQVDMIFTYNVLNILFTKLKELKSYYEVIQTDNEKLLKEKSRKEAEHLAYQVLVESLQKTVDERNEQLSNIREKLELDNATWQKEKKDISEKYEKELKSLRKKYELANNEKNDAVMRYAKNESELISIKEEKDNLLKKIKNLQNENQDQIKKYKLLINEKTSLTQSLDSKKKELAASLKNLEKCREELNCKDIKSKWLEENSQKELNQAKEKNDLLTLKITTLEKELSKYRSESTCSSQNADDNEEEAVFALEAEKMENNVENSDKCEERISLKEKGNVLIEENNSLTLKVQKLEKERLEYEKNITNMKQTCESQNQKITSLQNDLIEMATLRSSLKQLQDRIDSYQTEIDRLKEINDELRQDMESCREREAELLNFTEKLTAKNVSLQSDYATLESKTNALEAERAPIEKRIAELEDKIVELSEQLKNEIDSRNNDNTRLTKLITEKTKEIESLAAQLEEQQAENQSLKHKYSTTIRELTKEVQQYRKMRQFDSGECSSGSDSVCLESRTSSCNSLNEQQVTKIEPDRQTLIERIVKLQKVNAKHVEKIEFLEEHIAQLLTEVKKKSRVLQHYIVREQSGALSSDMMDQNKAEMTKYGGIMASIYTNKSDDGKIPLELSVEINQKLQAVLEDTLLKNITLKENIETLGKEIDRLNALNKSKQS